MVGRISRSLIAAERLLGRARARPGEVVEAVQRGGGGGAGIGEEESEAVAMAEEAVEVVTA